MAPINAHAFWLTYSQSTLAKQEVFDHLKTKGQTLRLIVCQETHQDGGLHIHALVEYVRKKCVLPSHFDLKEEHPNVKVWDRVVQYKQWLANHWQYCYKEDQNPLTEGSPPTADRGKRSRDDAVRECVEVARQEGLIAAQSRALDIIPELYLRSAGFDRVFMRVANERDSVPARSLDEFSNKPTIPENWHCLFLWGLSGTGKTEYARALLPKAKVVRHTSQLTEVRWADGIIFDDFPVNHWPATSVIHLVDWEVESGIDVKYGHVTIPANTRKIFTYNGTLEEWCRWDRKPDRGMTDEQFAAVRRRFTLVHHVASPLFGLARNPSTVSSYRVVDDYAMFRGALPTRSIETEERFPPAADWAQ